MPHNYCYHSKKSKLIYFEFSSHCLVWLSSLHRAEPDFLARKNSEPSRARLVHLPSPNDSLERGRERRIYSAGTKAPVGDQQPVLNIMQWHRVNVPTGAFALATWRHRVIARPGAVVRTLGTLFLLRLLVPVGGTTRCLFLCFGTKRPTFERRWPKVPAAVVAETDAWH